MKKLLKQYCSVLLIAVMILALFSTDFSIQVAAEEEDEFDVLRNKWKEMLIGGSGYDDKDPDISKVISRITSTAQSYWDDMNKSESRIYLWEDIGSFATSADLTSNYRRIRDMALAYSTEGSSLYKNAVLKIDIISALDWMYTNKYNLTVPKVGNWWDWEIGVPLGLNDATVLMYDDLTPEQVTNYMNAVERFQPTITMTAANRIWECTVIAVRGIIVKDGGKIAAARDGLSPIFDYSTSGNGFYKDGSFIEHERFAYSGGYGQDVPLYTSDLMYLLKGSQWEITDPDKQNAFRWIYDSYEPLMYKGSIMDMSMGRVIARYNYQDHVIGHYIIRAALRFSQFASPDDAAAFKSMAKEWIQTDTYLNFFDDPLVSIDMTVLAKNVLNDPNVVPRGDLVKYKQFAAMDRAVHFRPGFAFAISMYSNRIYNYESINSENLRGWHTADGMTYLYNNDTGQYSDAFWPTVDSYRLPGTTVLQNTAIPQRQLSDQAWIGGTDILGTYGVTGMALHPPGQTLHAKKSWFMFDDEIVALGAGINSTDNKVVETVVENRMIKNAGDNVLTVNGQARLESLGRQEIMDNIKWAHLQGNAPGSDIGYYFPDSTTVKGSREARTDAWSSICKNEFTNETPYTRNYVTLWYDHGINPADAKYSYVLLPNKSSEEVSSYATKPDITVIENSSEAQAVKENKLGITAINFWEDILKTVDKVTCDKKASVMTMKTPGKFEVSVSDPTQSNSGTINIEIDKSADYVISADANITVTQLSPTIRFSVNVNGLKGMASKIKFGYGDSISTPSGITLDKPEIIVNVAQKETLTLNASVIPEISEGQNHLIIWTSSDPTVATVSPAGIPTAQMSAGITPLKIGTAVITATTYDGRYSASCAVRVHEPSNYAYKKNAIEDLRSTHRDDGALYPIKAVDGDPATRWASVRSNNHWLYVDLGYEHIVNRVVLNWENGFGKEYMIEVSNSPEGQWKQVYSTAAGDGGIDNISFPDEKARYVRMNGQIRNGNYSFSIWEFEVYGPDDAVIRVEPADITRVIKGTSLDEVRLPSMVTVVCNNALIASRPVVWDTSFLNMDTVGEYVLDGEVEGTDIKATAKVIVTDKLGISLDQHEIATSITQTTTLRAATTSKDKTKGKTKRVQDQLVIWTSSDPTVATVGFANIPTTQMNATIIPYRVGTTTITATTYDGKYRASCVVRIHEPPNYAYKKDVVEDAHNTAAEGSYTLPSCAVDGDYTTRWTSPRSNNHWIYVDLGYEHIVNRVILNWETGFGIKYKVEVSNNPEGPWKEVYNTATGDGAIDDISFPDEKARYVRMNGEIRNGNYSFSIWEFEVYGPDDIIIGTEPIDDITVRIGTKLL